MNNFVKKHSPARAERPLVSVIIPTFNRGWVIAEAVESVVAQDYQSVEIIVVDDGSTDDTTEKLIPFMADITLLSQKNRGVSAARNTGIRVANGEFIAFLDSDDLWLPEKISCQVEFFRNNPLAMICQTEEIWIRNGKRVNPKKKHKKLSGMVFEPSLHLCLISPSAVMMKQSLFDISGNFDEELPACEDYDLWLRISASIPVYLIDKPLIIKRGGHDDQLSRNHSLDKYRISSLAKLLKGKLLSENQRRAVIKVFNEKCRIYAQGCMKRGKKKEAEYYEKLQILYNSHEADLNCDVTSQRIKDFNESKNS